MNKRTRYGALAVSLGLQYLGIRKWFLGWGATPEEQDARLPGDELLDDPTIVATRAITIDAPPSVVWPWLVQMGQDRGGLYSYAWLENIFKLGFHNADRIVPEWQTLEIGDQIRSAPDSAGPAAGFTVVQIEPERAIVTVVGEPDDVIAQVKTGKLPDGGTWVFILEPLGDDRTRMIFRLRARFGMGWFTERLSARMLEPVHFIMERKMMLGIKRRAERLQEQIETKATAARYPASAGAPRS